MTVTYTSEVATSTFGCFLKLLVRWRGSIYKLLWKDFVVYIVLYYVLRVIYRYLLTEPGKRRFESIAKYCDTYVPLIPLSFVLGFYVQQIVNRWQLQFSTLPFPDSTAVLVTANVKGLDEKGRLIRRTMMRYLMLGYVMTMRSIAPQVKKRFPTMKHLTQAGLMLPQEEKILENVKVSFNKYSIPFIWATSLVSLARKEGRIFDDYAVAVLNDSFNSFRQRLNQLFLFDWVGIPLVYTQVVTLCVYMYFVLTLFSQQFLLVKDGVTGKDVDLIVPIAAILQFLFFMGWLKVAETLINPFGEDDDDFDINSYIDRNMQVCYLAVDGMHADHPPLVKDMYWGTKQFELPYTQATVDLRRKSMAPIDQDEDVGSTSKVTVPDSKGGFVQVDGGGGEDDEAKRKKKQDKKDEKKQDKKDDKKQDKKDDKKDKKDDKKQDKKEELKREDSTSSIKSPSPSPSTRLALAGSTISATVAPTDDEEKKEEAPTPTPTKETESGQPKNAKEPVVPLFSQVVAEHETGTGKSRGNETETEDIKPMKVIDLPLSPNAVKRARRDSFLKHYDKVLLNPESDQKRTSSVSVIKSESVQNLRTQLKDASQGRSADSATHSEEHLSTT